MELALKLAGNYIVGKAKENLAHQLKHSNGILLNSVDYWLEDENTVCIGTKIEYGVYVELGTGLFAENGDGRKEVPWRYQDVEGNWWTTCGQHPNPWLRPALENNKDKIIKILGNNMEIKK